MSFVERILILCPFLWEDSLSEVPLYTCTYTNSVTLLNDYYSHFQLTDVNLNFVLCPATKDPFNGPYYRLAAVFHQALCLLTLGKLYSLVLHMCIPKSNKKKGKTS